MGIRTWGIHSYLGPRWQGVDKSATKLGVRKRKTPAFRLSTECTGSQIAALYYTSVLSKGLVSDPWWTKSWCEESLKNPATADGQDSWSEQCQLKILTELVRFIWEMGASMHLASNLCNSHIFLTWGASPADGRLSVDQFLADRKKEFVSQLPSPSYDGIDWYFLPVLEEV